MSGQNLGPLSSLQAENASSILVIHSTLRLGETPDPAVGLVLGFVVTNYPRGADRSYSVFKKRCMSGFEEPCGRQR